MNEPKREGEKRENDACLREKRESWIKKKTQMWRDERTKDGEKDQSEKEQLRSTRQNERKHARERERSEIESVHPLGYFCRSNNSFAAAEAPVGLQLCHPPRQSCNNWQSSSGCMLAVWTTGSLRIQLNFNDFGCNTSTAGQWTDCKKNC